MVVGDPKKNKLLCVKRCTVGGKTKVKLDFVAPEEPGDYALTLYFMSDSYAGCDQEYVFNLSVAQAASGEEEEEEEEEEA